MSILDGEQFITGGIVTNGVHGNATAASVKASVPAGNAYTFTANFTFVSAGQHLTFSRGKTYSLAQAVKAGLLAVSAPMVAA